MWNSSDCARPEIYFKLEITKLPNLQENYEHIFDVEL